MGNPKLRRAIALEAARLMYERVESEYFTAKRKAARRLCPGAVKPGDLPSNAEIRDQIQSFARLHEGDRRTRRLREMRLEALCLMRVLQPFRPRLIGSVMTGHVRKGSDIDLHVFTDNVGLVTDTLKREGYQFEVERKQVVKHNETRVFTHIHVFGRFNFELTVYPEDKAHFSFRSSITGKTMERATIPELEELLRREPSELPLEDELAAARAAPDPYPLYRMLLLPLENVRQNPAYHPEGDALYHSLQVFELARDVRPHDEEFLLAALLHDVGKGIDPRDHVRAVLDALEGTVTPRTGFLIAHHMHAHGYRAGTLPRKIRRELVGSPDLEDLLLLRELDDRGRQRGVAVGTVDEALDYLKELERANG